jgi:MFS family permease
MTGWCNRLWQFLTVRALEGFGETFYFPASMSLVSDYHRETRSRAMSLHQSSVYIGTIAGGGLGAWFAEVYGWRSAFYFFGGAGMLLAIVLYRFLREPPREGSRQIAALQATSSAALTVAQFARMIARNPPVLLLMCAFLGANFVATIFLSWTPTFLFEKFHFKLTSAGFSGAGFMNLGSAFSVPLGGWLADVLGRRFTGGRALVQATGLLFGSVFVFMVGTTEVVSTLLITMSLFGICKGIYDSNIFAALYDYIAPEARGTAAGLMNTVGWGGGALGPLAVGWISKHGPYATEMANMSHAIAWCGGIYVAAAALLLAAVCFRRRPN